jgi:two-component system, sensor histidine kinase and response regulator
VQIPESSIQRNRVTNRPEIGGAAAVATPSGGEKENRTLRILFVEDNPDDVELILRSLQKGGYTVVNDVVQTAEEFTRQIRSIGYDMILTDYNLPKWSGMEALELLRQENLDVPVILVTGALGDVTAVECIKQGASDYILKDNLGRLTASVRRALQEKQTREERKLEQEQLAQTVEDLARSNADLEQFAYVASHDLQEPLRMVAAYTQLIAERYRGRLDESADKYIDYASNGAIRMQTLIQDLLAFSRVGRKGATMKVTDCNVVVSQALRNLQSAIQESGAAVTCEPLPNVVCNSSQLMQVFQNLVGNALKFRGSEKPAIHINAVQTGNEWLFTVSDNGIGIAADCVGMIFSVFKRLHTQSEYPGNGIGLAICKKIVEQHRGKISVESEKGHGCKFQFTLPAIAVEETRN